MKEETKISVILPSLNVVSYIRECIESVVNQTLREIEIICVDAGSTDGTMEILKEYETQDERVKLLISDSKSYGHQMNLGMSVAEGEYIGIVETDDYIPKEMYEELYRAAKENNADLVKADFYRFVGEGSSLTRTLNKLTEIDTFYNRVINIEEEQECFLFPVNTWNGIYKRSFLLNHNIRHNETLGASFQDNGFWFQTFMYARRAFFIDKPYYMNRRDNPGSSVFSREKAFCICDEYRFIGNILKKNDCLYQSVKFSYTYACYRAYMGNIDRVPDREKNDFLQKFSDDFCTFRRKGELDFNMYSDQERDDLFIIMESPELFFHREVRFKRLLRKRAQSSKHIIIYGAGKVGKRTLDEWVRDICNEKNLYFGVTKKEGQLDSYHGVSVCDIHELSKYREESLVVIATAENFQPEIYETLRQLGFRNILPVSYDGRKKEMYYRALDRKEYSKELEEWYRCFTGKNLSLQRPVGFNEKQQWLKINDNTGLKARLSDKVNMREWADSIIGEEYLIPLLGIYERSEDIVFKDLPERFVLRCTHGSGMSIFIDKENPKEFREEEIKGRLDVWLRSNYAFQPMAGLDLNYADARPCVVAEQLVGGISWRDNYKILCFDGKPVYIVVDTGEDPQKCRHRDLFDMEWKHFSVRIKYSNAPKELKKPKHLEEMRRMSEKLSEGFYFAVVHFFDTDAGIFFDKIKFTFGNGIEFIMPEEFEAELSNRLKM